MSRLAVIAIALCACRDAEFAEVKAIRDEVCACPTAECGDKAMKQLPTPEGKPSHRVQVLANEMMACMKKLYLKKDPAEDADDETGSATP